MLITDGHTYSEFIESKTDVSLLLFCSLRARKCYNFMKELDNSEFMSMHNLHNYLAVPPLRFILNSLMHKHV